MVGIALSPEYVYTIGPGALMPDDRRYGVMWLGREAMQAAFDLDGAFNDISATLLHGVDPEAVIDRMDELLAPLRRHRRLSTRRPDLQLVPDE